MKMTQAELKNLFRSTLQAQRSIAQEYTVLDAIVDFIAQALTTGIPAWTSALTFNTDGTGDGTFSIYEDTAGTIRFWKTKTDGNINNAPPTNPVTTENTWWIEVSPSDGSAIKEWAPGIYGPGLVIVYYDISGTGSDPALYILLEPTRPFESTNFATELAAIKWKKMSGSGGGGSGLAIADSYGDVAALIAAQGAQVNGAWYFVSDASADSTVTSDWAIYAYLGTTNGDLTDYTKIMEKESLDLVVIPLDVEIHAATSKTTPVDADELGIWDSVANALKKLTWANLKSTLKTYFDTLYLSLAGGSLSGALNEAKGADTASAATVDLGAIAGNYANITGTTTITSFGNAPQAGIRKRVTFKGILTLTYNASSLLLPTAVNIVTAVEDSAVFMSLNNTGDWKCVGYTRADGSALVGASPTVATQSEMITGTNNTKMVTPLAAESKRSILSNSFSNAATGSSTIDCGSRQENKVVYNTTVTGAITVALSNSSNLETLHIIIPITGSNIAITFPSTTRMNRSYEVSSGDGWYYSTYILQVSSVGTADLHEFSLVKSGSVYKLNYDGPSRA